MSVYRVNPCGLVPKKDTNPIEYRTISHQSAPKGSGINDGISKLDFETKYENVAHAARWIRHFGRNCQLVKVDIQEAYRILPIHPLDQPLQGIVCQGKLYFDLRVAFGSRSAPGIFCRFADLLAWIAIQWGLPAVIHYIDDFLIIVPRAGEAAKTLFLSILDALSVPYKLKKLEGPTTRLVYLGITLDTTDLTASIPEGKRDKIIELLQGWHKKRWCFLDELRSLVGSLIWLTQVMPQARIFIQSFINLMKGRSGVRTRLSLKAQHRQDLDWWLETLPNWKTVDYESIHRRE